MAQSPGMESLEFPLNIPQLLPYFISACQPISRKMFHPLHSRHPSLSQIHYPCLELPPLLSSCSSSLLTIPWPPHPLGWHFLELSSTCGGSSLPVTTIWTLAVHNPAPPTFPPCCSLLSFKTQSSPADHSSQFPGHTQYFLPLCLHPASLSFQSSVQQ